MVMRHAGFLIASASFFLSASALHATVVQTVRTTAVPTFGPTNVDLDSETAATPDGIDEDIFAQSLGPGGSYSLFASAGRFGQVGLSGRTIAPGRFTTEVEILDNDIFNPTTSARRATANFIVDGGDMALVAAAGSSLSFNLLIEAAIGGSVGTVFDSFVRLDVDAQGATQFSVLGDSLDAQKSAIPFAAEIPLSFQSVDLGIVGPNETLGLRYTASFDANVIGFAEVVEFGFSDPLTVGLQPVSIRFEPATLENVAPVPLPAGAPLLVAGLAALAWLRRRGGCMRSG
jgi:hypothetical protein